MATYGNEGMITECETEKVGYLFKLRSTKKVREKIILMVDTGEWVDAVHGWQGCESTIQLTGWRKARKVILLRQQLTKQKKTQIKKNPKQVLLGFEEVLEPSTMYKYQVLVTSLSDEIVTIAQHYRDRAGCENNFDELKNQWGWCGFTTQDMKRCSIMANFIALVYNWWSLYVRLSEPKKHSEAITSRPLLLEGVAIRKEHARQTEITVSNLHEQAEEIQKRSKVIRLFFKKLRSVAPQLTAIEIWCRILSQALVKYLRGRQLKLPIISPRLLGRFIKVRQK